MYPLLLSEAFSVKEQEDFAWNWKKIHTRISKRLNFHFSTISLLYLQNFYHRFTNEPRKSLNWFHLFDYLILFIFYAPDDENCMLNAETLAKD